VQRAGQAPAYKVGDAVKPFTTQTVSLKVRQPDGSLTAKSFTTYASEQGPVVREEGGKWIAYA